MNLQSIVSYTKESLLVFPVGRDILQLLMFEITIDSLERLLTNIVCHRNLYQWTYISTETYQMLHGYDKSGLITATKVQ